MRPSAHYVFSLLPPGTLIPATEYLRLTQKGSRKRKRRKITVAALGDIADDESASGEDYLSQSLEYTAVLTPDERSQRRLAGQPLAGKIPGGHFPHTPATSTKKRFARDQHQETQSSLPMGTDGVRKSRGPTLHVQHLGVMTAILHRCLMEKDFVRAGRALGILLRDHIRGQAIDPRSEGRWGFGPEILLLQGTAHQRHIRTQDEALVAGGTEHPTVQSGRSISLEGYHNAKRYLERLIIQFPFQKASPNTVNALDFYPALFGLWIFVTQEENRRFSESVLSSQRSPTVDLGANQVWVLKQAREIAARLDSVLGTLPFSDDLELIRLRSMVGLWIADCLDSLAQTASAREESMDMDADTEQDVATHIEDITSAPSPTARPELALRTEANWTRAKARDLLRRLSEDVTGLSPEGLEERGMYE